MFDFAAYSLHGKMLELEARDKPAFLRDMHGKVHHMTLEINMQTTVRGLAQTKTKTTIGLTQNLNQYRPHH